MAKTKKELITQTGDAWDRLPAKKQLFIKTLHETDWNKTQSGLAAGCKSPESALVCANNWLKEPDIQMAIEIYQKKFNRANNLTIDDLKSELWKNHLRAARVSDSNKALELICRLLGAFKDSLDIEGKVGIAQVLADLTLAGKKSRLEGPDDIRPLLEARVVEVEASDKEPRGSDNESIDFDKESNDSDNEENEE